MILLTTILLTFVITSITWWYIQLQKCNKYLWKYAGPFPVPFLGNVLSISSNKDVVPVMMSFIEAFGQSVRIMLGHRPRIVIADPHLAEFLLSSTEILEKSYEYKFFHKWLGTGLLTSSSVKWKRQRKLITPTFHFQILEQFIDTFDCQSNILIEKLRTEIGGNPFDVFPYITLCALDIICEAAMGTCVNAQRNSDSEYVRSVKEMCRIVVERAFSPAKMTDFLYPFFKDYYKENSALKVLHGYTNSVIEKRREELLKHLNQVETNHDDVGIKRRLAFLDLLLQASVDGKPLPNDVIREEVDTFMFEGHDTTTSGISFTLYCLSKNPDVQKKAIEELKNIFEDDKDRSATYKDLQNMKYLDMVIKESLRLYPPVPVYGRILQEDVNFDGDVLPEGLSLTVFAYGLHRNPKSFPDPDKFDPERFALENSSGRSPYAYVPFSAGPRNCIGQRFAILEMKSTISKILRNFELLSVADHQPVLLAEAILKSANGLPIRIKERKC